MHTLTDEKIDALEGGVLARAVAEHVMGWDHLTAAYRVDAGWRPDLAIQTAWQVLENAPHNWNIQVRRTILGNYVCEYGVHRGKADTAPLAICRAALRAVREREPA